MATQLVSRIKSCGGDPSSLLTEIEKLSPSEIDALLQKELG
ncbi:MAG: hypothetical protein ACXW3L_09995 [Limisphaerales bacterium]